MPLRSSLDQKDESLIGKRNLNQNYKINKSPLFAKSIVVGDVTLSELFTPSLRNSKSNNSSTKSPDGFGAERFAGCDVLVSKRKENVIK